jgi:hypothetical protein
MNKYVFPYCNTTPDNKYIEYITRINPEYILEYIFCPASCPMYFCCKDGGIIIVHLSDDGKNIISYPLSELKDWKWLNAEKNVVSIKQRDVNNRLLASGENPPLGVTSTPMSSSEGLKAR